MSINSIPLFFDESSISKRINMTSVFEENAASNAQNCTWYQKFSSKISKFSSCVGRVLDSSADLAGKKLKSYLVKKIIIVNHRCLKLWPVFTQKKLSKIWPSLILLIYFSKCRNTLTVKYLSWLMILEI